MIVRAIVKITHVYIYIIQLLETCLLAPKCLKVNIRQNDLISYGILFGGTPRNIGNYIYFMVEDQDINNFT